MSEMWVRASVRDIKIGQTTTPAPTPAHPSEEADRG